MAMKIIAACSLSATNRTLGKLLNRDDVFWGIKLTGYQTYAETSYLNTLHVTRFMDTERMQKTGK